MMFVALFDDMSAFFLSLLLLLFNLYGIHFIWMMAFHVNQCINNEIPLRNINYQMRSALICIQSSNAIRALQIDCAMSFAFILTIKSHISHWTMQSYNRISCKQYNLQFSNTSFICQRVAVFVYCCIIFIFILVCHPFMCHRILL